MPGSGGEDERPHQVRALPGDGERDPAADVVPAEDGPVQPATSWYSVRSLGQPCSSTTGTPVPVRSYASRNPSTGAVRSTTIKVAHPGRPPGRATLPAHGLLQATVAGGVLLPDAVKPKLVLAPGPMVPL
jgi:hypothetical protein